MLPDSSSKTVDNSSVVGSEATTAGVDRATVYSKIGERGERFPVGSEAITVKVVATSVSSRIKIGEGFSMRSYFQELKRNFHYPRLSPGNVERVGSLERASKNLVTGTPNSAEGIWASQKIQTLTWVPIECTIIGVGCELGP